MAVPGRVDEPGAAGCNRLIQEGAALVTSAKDVLGALGLEAAPVPESHGDEGVSDEPADLDPTERRVLALLSPEPCHVDEVIEASGLPAEAVFGALTALELGRAVRAWPGKLYQRL
jgi:DNA processing protein